MPKSREIPPAMHAGRSAPPRTRRAGMLGAIACAMVLAGCGESIPVDSHNRSPADDDSHVVENAPLEAPAAEAGGEESARSDGETPEARDTDTDRR